MATPIINHPEVAILGVHKISKRPAVRNDKIEIRDLMNLSISVDHRVVDGYDAARFVAAIKAKLEAPQRALSGSGLTPAMATAKSKSGGLPMIRAGMGDVDSETVEVWSDDDHAARDRAADHPVARRPGESGTAMPALSAEAARDAYRTMLRMRVLGERARALVSGRADRRLSGHARRRGGDRRRGGGAGRGRRHRPRAARGGGRAAPGTAGRCAGRAALRQRQRHRPRPPACRPRRVAARAERHAGVVAAGHAAAARGRHRVGDEDAGQGAAGARVSGSRRDQRRGLSRRAELRRRVRGARPCSCA